MKEALLRRWHRLLQSSPDLVPPLQPLALTEDEPLVHAVLETRGEVRRILMENILPFWFPACIDESGGGYQLVSLGTSGSPGSTGGGESKLTIPVARICWFFSRMAREKHLAEGLSAADHGFRFLRDHLWDGDEGGFFWEVSPDGSTPLNTRKRLYAQAFGLYAVAEYARASGNGEARAFAEEVAVFLEGRFRDSRWGGYWEELVREEDGSDRASSGAREKPDPRARMKTFNAHLHMLEALSAFSKLSDADMWHTRIWETLLILTNTVYRGGYRTSTDWHREDWTPLLEKNFVDVSYGHDLEAVWMVQAASMDLGIPPSLFSTWGRALFDHALQWGWDRKRGGVYFRGPLGGPAYNREKVFWVQAEVLVSTLMAFRATGDPRYGELYLSTLDWVTHRQVDWSGGEWHAEIREDGRIEGAKAGLWKSPYHTGRSMMMCLRLLEPGKELCLGGL